MKKKLVVLIPALNEEKNIREVIQGVREAITGEIVVIDDASSDSTARVARAEGVKVLPLLLRLGAWGATRTGIRYASQHFFEIAVTMDADGQHLPDAIASLIDPILSNRADVVIGSCTERGSVPRKLSWLFFRMITGLDVRDLTSGFRAYNAAAISTLMTADTALLDYQDIGILLALNKAGFRILEVPVRMRPRSSGHSRVFSSWWDVLRYLVITLILCLSKVDMSAVSGYRSEIG
ncbi:MAG: glycosyltransferase family 2 protein [Deltaproteobacteria bacterium]|nr:glycosyltransferase family 2 protein [Deltaproteobacteria bacterium]